MKLTLPKQDWASSEFGECLEEEHPANRPEERGIGFTMSAKVDADHAADTTTRRSRTGFLVFLNCALMHWSSKKQASIESSSFGSEFTAMKQCTECVRGLRHKLKMMGIPINGPTFIFGDNQSVLANTTIPDSTSKKKSQSIACHFVREGVARDEWRTAHVNTHDNAADLLTKPLPANEKRRTFVENASALTFVIVIIRRAQRVALELLKMRHDHQSSHGNREQRSGQGPRTRPLHKAQSGFNHLNNDIMT